MSSYDLWEIDLSDGHAIVPELNSRQIWLWRCNPILMSEAFYIVLKSVVVGFFTELVLKLTLSSAQQDPESCNQRLLSRSCASVFRCVSPSRPKPTRVTMRNKSIYEEAQPILINF